MSAPNFVHSVHASVLCVVLLEARYVVTVIFCVATKYMSTKIVVSLAMKIETLNDLG